MNSRLLALWESRGPEAEEFRARWIRQAPDVNAALAMAHGQIATNEVNNTAKLQVNGQLTSQMRCPHLWKRVRDAEGKVAQKPCGGCRGKRQLDLFECRCPERQKDGQNDHVTLEDCKTCAYRPMPMPEELKDVTPPVPVKVQPRKLIFHLHLSPGDVLCLTAAVYSLHKQHPGRFITGVDTSCPHLWENNPDIAKKEELEGAEVVAVRNMLINQCNQRAVHVMQDYCDFLAHALQVPVPLLTNRPLVYVSEEEKGWMDQIQQETGRKQKFWVLNAGVKQDYTSKQYPHFARVVEILQGKVVFVQVGSVEHMHKPLKGVINLLGKTDQRQMVRLCYHAQGVLTGVSFPMHLAAALCKPCVVVAGAREPQNWNQYPGQRLLANVGSTPCSIKEGVPEGCWKSRVIRLGDGQEQDNSLCENPVPTELPSGRCMAMITPEQVVEAIESYYAGGVLAY